MVTCHALIEIAYARVLDLFLTVVSDLKSFKAPLVADCNGPDEIVREIEAALGQARSIIKAKEEIRLLFPQPTTEEMASLRQLHEIITRIEKQVRNPLARLAKRNPKPKEFEKPYRRIAKIGIAISKALISQHNLVAGRLGTSAVNLRSLLEATQVERVISETMSCVSIDMARYSVLARRIQGSQDAKALFEFNQNLQAQLRSALKEAGADPSTVPIDDTGDGALIFVREAHIAMGFAIEVQKSSFAKNLKVPTKEWHQNLRIGIDTGNLVLDVMTKGEKVLSFNSAGVPIINAVRIQSNCPKGKIAVSRATWGQLNPEKQQPLFGQFKSLKPADPKKRGHEPALEMCVTKVGAGL